MESNISIAKMGEAVNYLTCHDCSVTGPDVGRWQYYVGGRGYVWFSLCNSESDCENHRAVARRAGDLLVTEEA